MSRNEADRDDLLAEVVALTRRVELRTPSHGEPVVIGFRANGWLSIYFGSDPMYQFDESGQLRRAFVGGLLYRTQGTTLAQLRRERSASESTLLRRDLTELELVDFQRIVREAIEALRQHLVTDQIVILRRIPIVDVRLIDDIAAALARAGDSTEFLAPAIAGKT